MSFRRRKYESLLLKSDNESVTAGIEIVVQIAAQGTGKFTELKCLLDTGLIQFVAGLPADIAEKLGIEATTQAEGQLADGSMTQKLSEGTCDLRVKDVVVSSVPVLVGSIPMPILGYQFLQFVNLSLAGGTPVRIEINDERINALAAGKTQS